MVSSSTINICEQQRTDQLEISKKELDGLGLFASVLGHIGDGNFHMSIMYDRKDPVQVAAVEQCVGSMVDRALEMDGTITGEHGVSHPSFPYGHFPSEKPLTRNTDRPWQESRSSKRSGCGDHRCHASNQEVIGSLMDHESR